MNHRILSTATLAVMLLCFATARADNPRPRIYKPVDGENLRICALSDNGRYAISQNAGNQEVDNPQPEGGSILDLQTMQLFNIPAPSGMAGVSDVSDNGLVAGSCDGLPAVWNMLDGSWTKYPVTNGTDCGAFLAITPDGHYAVGYFGRSTDILYAEPMCYDLTTGTRVSTPNLPEVDLSGENQDQNVFYGISPDGRYILGQMSQSFLLPLSPVSYIYDTTTLTWTPVGYDYNPATKRYAPKDAALHFINDQTMSADGNWITGTAYVVNDGGAMDGGSEYNAPYRYHVPTATFELYTSDEDIAGNRITNDGVILGSMPAGNPYPTAVVRSGRFFITLDQILSQVYNMTLHSQIGDNVTGAFECLSADGRTAVMLTYDNCYIIEMPEPFADAAARVDLLATYTPSIPAGSEISKIGEIKITFDREVECRNLPSQVQLLKSDGTPARNANSTVVSPSNSHQITIAFRTVTLDPDETYTLHIPEGYIWLKDDPSVKSHAIDITYCGRSSDPVQPLSMSPADGSVLAELNYTSSYITISFDVDVKPGQGTCALYNDDDGTMLVTLQCNTAGNKAYFFPEGSYMLYYGSNYRVEIGEGAVTDMSGNGASAPVTLHYRGAYVRPASDDDRYLFKADCNDYDHFIFHSNQTNTPAQVPASWGFTELSTWLLVRDSEDDTDQALCSHSMFVPAGAADDWLMTPQLYIPDDKASLVFDAQSYLKTKTDRLQVYVYPCDMIYNYLNHDITDDILANADPVLDVVLTPGATEEVLAGEWTRYTVDLGPYAGRNVYIAFANRNNDQSAVFIDNVQVIRDLDFTLTNSTPVSVVARDAVTVQGVVTPGIADNDIHGIAMTLRDSGGTTVSTIDEPSLTITSAEPYAFHFDTDLPLTVGEVADYYIDVVIGDKSTTLKYSVSDLAFKPERRVVLEEYSGTSCGNCPLGFCAVENLLTLYPDNFIPIVIRTFGDDRNGRFVTGYSQFLGLDNYGAPSGRINRGEILAPMMQTSSGYVFSGRGIVEADGTEAYLWADAVADELATPTALAVDFSAAYDESTGVLTVPVQIRSALNAQLPVSLLAVVIENNIMSRQLNYFFTVSDPNLGPWGAGGSLASNNVYTPVDHMARYVVNGSAYNGTPMSTADFIAGEVYHETLTVTLPADAITNPVNCEVVVMAIDGSSHKILNANRAAFGTSGISSAVNDGTAVRVGTDGVTVSTDGSFTAALYSVSGTLMGNVQAHGTATLPTRGYHGPAILTVTTAKGTSHHKIVIK